MTNGMPPVPARAHIGTTAARFEYRRGALCAVGTDGADSMQRIAASCDTVEVRLPRDTLPRAATVLEWVDAAPPGFTYALTAPHRITHELRFDNVETKTLAFLDVAASMGEVAAPVLFQFPADFTRARHGRALARWMAWLAARRRGLRVAIEVRAGDLSTPAFVSYAASLGFAVALVDRVGAPDLFPTWADEARSGSGPDFAYVRWCGKERDPAHTLGEEPHACEDSLALWAGRVRWLVDQGQAVFAYVHGTSVEGALATARRLRALLDGEGPPPGCDQRDGRAIGAKREPQPQLF